MSDKKVVQTAMQVYQAPRSFHEIIQSLDGLLRLGKVLVESGLAPASVKTPAAAVAILLQGWELGIGPMAALSNIYPISGKPTISPLLMLALARRTGELEDIQISDDGEKCTVTVKRAGQSPFTTSFSMEDAKRILTIEYGQDGQRRQIRLADKFNWRQYPAEMRQWRALAKNLRVTFGDAILRLYIPEEVEGLPTEREEEGAPYKVLALEDVAVSLQETAAEPEEEEQAEATEDVLPDEPLLPSHEIARGIEAAKAKAKTKLPKIQTAQWTALLAWAKLNGYAVEQTDGGEKRVNPFRLLNVLGGAGIGAITDDNFKHCMDVIAEHYKERAGQEKARQEKAEQEKAEEEAEEEQEKAEQEKAEEEAEEEVEAAQS